MMTGTGTLEHLNAAINNSSTWVEKAGADLTEPAHKAVMYDDDGNVIVATSGDKTIGFLLSDSPAPIKKGQSVTFLIKQIGLAVAGAAMSKGDLLTVENGQVKKATSGTFVVGRAFTAAATAGQAVQIQINPMGYMA